jgi:rhodanese-related sulfurtransferase/thioredoxin-related protein
MKKKILSTLWFAIFLIVNSMAQNETVTLTDFVKKLNAATNPQILDARSPEEYAQNHIKGAININLKDSGATSKLITSLNSKYPTFTYSINNGRSSVLAKKLRAQGFKSVYELPGGLSNWVGSGNPIESFNNKGLAVTGEQFRELTQSKELVLVDFGSKYCGYCRKLIPVLDSLENNHASNLKIVRIEMYDNPELVKNQKIKSLPTLVLYKNGEIVWNNNGNINYNQLLAAIQNKAKLLANK